MNRVLPKIIIAAFFILAVVAGCSDTTEPEADLVANLSLSVVEANGLLPLSVFFVLDPMGTTSNLSPVDSLKIRWDSDGNGEWEFDFRYIHIIERARLLELPFSTWSARVEVQDQAGNHSIASQSISLPSKFPAGPDLVVGELLVIEEHWSLSHRDSIAVGTEFFIHLPARMWGDYSMVNSTIRCFIDGMLVSEEEIWVPGPFLYQDVNYMTPQGSFVWQEPGPHLIEAEVILPPTIPEFDSTNNRKAKTVEFY